MKINGTIFSKPQQDQLKRGIGAELDKVVAKVDDVDARMLNYMGDWASGNEYHENDVVTWADDGHLYEVIKAHTSSSTIDPIKTEYYKAMTTSNYKQHTIDLSTTSGRRELISLCSYSTHGKKITMARPNTGENKFYSIGRYGNNSVSLYCVYQSTGANQPFYLSVITLDQNAVYESLATFNTVDSTLTINQSTVSGTVKVYIEA